MHTFYEPLPFVPGLLHIPLLDMCSYVAEQHVAYVQHVPMSTCVVKVQLNRVMINSIFCEVEMAVKVVKQHKRKIVDSVKNISGFQDIKYLLCVYRFYPLVIWKHRNC